MLALMMGHLLGGNANEHITHMYLQNVSFVRQIVWMRLLFLGPHTPAEKDEIFATEMFNGFIATMKQAAASEQLRF